MYAFNAMAVAHRVRGPERHSESVRRLIVDTPQCRTGP
jgi:hypothetical protein